MNSIARHVGAIGLGLIPLTYPQYSLADSFTGNDFSNWERVSQDSYIQSSIMMAGVIASQIKPEISSCIDSWYFESESVKSTRNNEIRALVSQYSTYHPSGVILAAVQQECGAFE